MRRRLIADWIYTLSGEAIRDGFVELDERGKILDVGKSRPGEEGEYFAGALCPGFINAHCHLELSHMQGKIAAGRGLVQFILDLQGSRTAEAFEVLDAMRSAEVNLLDQGVVALGDISNGEQSFVLKSESRLLFHTFIEAFAFNPGRAQAAWEQALGLKQAYFQVFEAAGRIRDARASITPHAPYSVSEALFKLISAGETGLLSIHNQESSAENDFYLAAAGDFCRLYEAFGLDISFFKAFGRRSLSVYQEFLGIQKKLLVHNTYSIGSDFGSPASGYALCLCPKANLYIEGKLPDIDMLVALGLPILIGTDSLASNDSLSMLDEMRVLQHAYGHLSTETLLGWACLNASRFFDWPQLGSLEIGKTPGIVLLSDLGEGGQILAHSSSKRIA